MRGDSISEATSKYLQKIKKQCVHVILSRSYVLRAVSFLSGLWQDIEPDQNAFNSDIVILLSLFLLTHAFPLSLYRFVPLCMCVRLKIFHIYSGTCNSNKNLVRDFTFTLRFVKVTVTFVAIATIAVIRAIRNLWWKLTVLSFFHLWMRPNIPEVTDNSPSDGGCNESSTRTALLLLMAFVCMTHNKSRISGNAERRHRQLSAESATNKNMCQRRKTP